MTLEQAKVEIEALGSRDAQWNYIESLSPELQDELEPWLRERKRQAAEAKAQAQRAEAERAEAQQADARRLKRRDELL